MKSGDRQNHLISHSGDSFVGCLDPRAKLLVVISFLIGGFFSASLWYSAIAGALFVVAIVSAGVSLASLRKISQSILILAAITVAFHILFSPDKNPPYWTVFGLSITAESLRDGSYYALRLVSFALAALFLSLTTTPVDMAEGVVKICRPLRILKVPLDDLGLILSLAFRFIPLFRDEMLMIRRAQSLRGVLFSGNYITRIRNTVPLLVPVFVSAINRADTVAMAIEARGYVYNRRRSYYSRHAFGVRESVFVIVGLLVVGSLLLWTP
jgi:energy-coupling factor transport system permease protein